MDINYHSYHIPLQEDKKCLLKPHDIHIQEDIAIDAVNGDTVNLGCIMKCAVKCGPNPSCLIPCVVECFGDKDKV